MSTTEQSINVSDLTFVADAEELASKTADSEVPVNVETAIDIMEAFEYGQDNGKEYIAVVVGEWLPDSWASEYPSESKATNILVVETIKDWSERAWFVEEARYLDGSKFHPLNHNNDEQAAEYGERDKGTTWLPKGHTHHILMQA